MQIGKKTSTLLKALFHKRNIIIMSERSTSHLSMSGKIQFAIIALVLVVIGTASFSTGRYMAAQQVISEQGKTIKSVANSRVKTTYSYGVPSLSGDVDIDKSHAFAAPLNDPSYTFAGMDESKLVARIAFLETQVEDLSKTNKDIVNVVRKTAAGQIKGLEEIIQQTGLSPDTLKRQAKQEKKIPNKSAARLSAGDDGKGGPFIPPHWDEDMRNFVEDVEYSADELYALRKIMEMMPVARPMSKKARYTSGFGHRRDPFSGRVAFHSGLDFASKTSPQIVATADGVVNIAERRGAYGNLIEIKHGLGITTRYGHLSRIMVKAGQKVKKGDLIGIQGSTGRSTGAHLHYEVRFNNRPLNPRGFLKAGEAYVQQN